jgi:hypothetical protein
MYLKEMIEYLEKEPPEMVVPMGFGNTCSYRGDYSELAFIAAPNTTIKQMLALARGAIGRGFPGWKGGEYTMTEYCRVYLVNGCGETGDEIGPILLDYMAGKYGSSPPGNKGVTHV